MPDAEHSVIRAPDSAPAVVCSIVRNRPDSVSVVRTEWPQELHSTRANPAAANRPDPGQRLTGRLTGSSTTAARDLSGVSRCSSEKSKNGLATVIVSVKPMAATKGVPNTNKSSPTNG